MKALSKAERYAFKCLLPDFMRYQPKKDFLPLRLRILIFPWPQHGVVTMKFDRNWSAQENYLC